jgi:hypothetical protein
MKTIDGYVVKTSDSYQVISKNPDDYNYPLTAFVHPPKIYSASIHVKTFDVVVDQ